MFLNQSIIERLVFLADFNQLINESDPESSVESLQEITLYAILAIINHTQSMVEAQQIYGQCGLVMTLVKQLKNGVFEPKQSALLCLSNLITNVQANKQLLLQANGIMLLTEMISDEDGEEAISEKAYKCLEIMGITSI